MDRRRAGLVRWTCLARNASGFVIGRITIYGSFSPVELRHLRYFVAVAEALSFTKGAQKLHLSQPSLTRQIKALEEEVGVRLLDRNRQGVSLTRQGASFLTDAKRILSLSVDIVDSARRSSDAPLPPLNIGYVADLFYDLLPVTLKAFQRSFPTIPINLFDMSCGDQFSALEDGRIDLGFVGLREPIAERGLQFLPIGSYPTVAALAKNHPLAKERCRRTQKTQTDVFYRNVRGQLSGVPSMADGNVPESRLRPKGSSGYGDRANLDPSRRGRAGRGAATRPGKKPSARQRGLP